MAKKRKTAGDSAGAKGAAEKQQDRELPTTRNCGTMAVHERMLRTIQGYREARDASENQALRAQMFPAAGRTGCTRIPVVVHVVHRTAAQNLSDAQIKSQIDVLNADFRKKNGDIGAVPGAFAPLAGDARIEFELAKTDPSGNPTTGITRRATTVTAFSDDNAVKFTSSGGTDAWPRDNYLNVWVCPLAGGLLGYAQFPGGPAATDGVVIRHSAFGTTGTAAAPFNLGRTATHEIGHWLNLRHIWGDDGNGCAGSDFVADTPNQASENTGTPTFPHISCGNGPNGDMFMNYMDYTDDVGMMMFSSGQVTRMQATLDGFRASIGTSIPCGKSIPKEVVKETPKDIVKERPKEFTKELAKDPAVEPPKNIVADVGPKSIFDPPKSFQEPPIEIPILEGGPVAPAVTPFAVPLTPVTPLAPAIPFTLATGGGGIGREHTAALAHAYLQLLSHYTRLHAMGQLDAAGMAAWQQAVAAYQRLVMG